MDRGRERERQREREREREKERGRGRGRERERESTPLAQRGVATRFRGLECGLYTNLFILNQRKGQKNRRVG